MMIKLFPNKISTVMSCSETLLGFGFMLGRYYESQENGQERSAILLTPQNFEGFLHRKSVQC